MVDQEPAANQEAPRGSEVTLFVSQGPADRPVPNVVGKTVAEASNLLGQAGFTVNQTSEASSSVEEGRVIRTDPPADAVRPKGSAVTVVVSSGPAEVLVPLVEDLLRSSARMVLESAGFAVAEEGATTPDCAEDQLRVDSQRPAGNTTAVAGSTITIVLICDVPPARPEVGGG